MKHFLKHITVRKYEPILLLLDNHQSRLSVRVPDLSEELLLSLQPRTSHKVKPLYESIYGPFMKFVNRASDGWLRSHPGRL
jgi:hypothetical protein